MHLADILPRLRFIAGKYSFPITMFGTLAVILGAEKAYREVSECCRHTSTCCLYTSRPPFPPLPLPSLFLPPQQAYPDSQAKYVATRTQIIDAELSPEYRAAQRAHELALKRFDAQLEATRQRALDVEEVGEESNTDSA